MKIVDWAPGLRVGAGYDDVRGDEKQEAVLGAIETPPDAAGQQGETSFVLARSSDEVDSCLDIGASVKVGAGPFGGSAKMKFREQCKVSNEATFCILNIGATNAYQQLVRPALSPEAAELLSTGKTDRFRQRFGDSFVSGQFVGVEFYGVVRIEASSKARQTSLATSIQASYGLMASGKTHAGFNESLSSESHRIEIHTYQTGGTVNVCKELGDLAAAGQRALDDARSGRGYPFQVTLDPYTELKLPNDGASLIDTERARRAVKGAMDYVGQLTKILNDIDFVRRNIGWYSRSGLTKDRLNAMAAEVSAEINRLWDAADTCSRHFDQCREVVPNFPGFDMPEPDADAPAEAAHPPAGRPGLGRRPMVLDLIGKKPVKMLSPALLRRLDLAKAVKPKK